MDDKNTMFTLGIALAFMLLIALVNPRPVGESVKANIVLTLVEVSRLLLVIMVGLWASARHRRDWVRTDLDGKAPNDKEPEIDPNHFRTPDGAADHRGAGVRVLRDACVGAGGLPVGPGRIPAGPRHHAVGDHVVRAPGAARAEDLPARPVRPRRLSAYVP